MIGQVNLRNKLSELTKTKFPRFVILTGRKGQGKKTIAHYIANKLNYPLITIDTKIENIREMIELANKLTEPVIYLIGDADKMSIGAKNSLLKVIEEPPNNAYFIMTLEQIENTLETIKSRCIQFQLEEYNLEELDTFIEDIDNCISKDEKWILEECCLNYYQIKLIYNYGITEFYEYVKKVANNIYKVPSANSFKITEKLNIKEDGQGYNIKLFLTAIINIYYNQAMSKLNDNSMEALTEFTKSLDSVAITSNTLHKININGINKQSLLDMWILDIRKVWRS